MSLTAATSPIPEIILPAQYFARTRADLAPAQRLLLALLQDALECAIAAGRSRRSRRLRREAHHWIFAPAASAPLTFGEVCEGLNIDPAYLRGGLTRWLRAAQSGRALLSAPYRQSTRRYNAVTGPRRRARTGRSRLAGAA